MRIPPTDSIQELADFWDTHSVTDFDDQLEERGEPCYSTPKRISSTGTMGP